MRAVELIGIRFAGFAVLIACASGAACATVSCPPSTRPPDALAVEVGHVEGSDAPTAWSLRVYTNGVLELEKLGKRPICRRTPVQNLDELIRLLQSAAFQEAIGLAGSPGHEEWMQVIHRGTARRFVAEHLPPEVLSVFEELDRLFSKEFGRRYSWPLIRHPTAREHVPGADRLGSTAVPIRGAVGQHLGNG